MAYNLPLTIIIEWGDGEGNYDLTWQVYLVVFTNISDISSYSISIRYFHFFHKQVFFISPSSEEIVKSL